MPMGDNRTPPLKPPIGKRSRKTRIDPVMFRARHADFEPAPEFPPLPFEGECGMGWRAALDVVGFGHINGLARL